jgi:hypothetical protein
MTDIRISAKVGQIYKYHPKYNLNHQFYEVKEITQGGILLHNINTHYETIVRHRNFETYLSTRELTLERPSLTVTTVRKRRIVPCK